MLKKIIFFSYSLIFILTLLYFLLYIYTFLTLEKSTQYKFSSLEIINFYKDYSNKLHHLRGGKIMWEENVKNTEYIYSTIKEFHSTQKNILLQGDSWFELINYEDDDLFYKSRKFLEKISEEKNLGLINAGITSYSPSLMKLQLETLEKDFDVKPNVLVVFIDQTDIGDENCRYKNNKIYKNNELTAIKVEEYSGRPFDYTKKYGESEILLKEKSQIKKIFYLLNFRIKYQFLKNKNKNISKIKRIINNGFQSRKIEKCYWSDIENYLSNSSSNEIEYFKKTTEEYFDFIENKKNLNKIIIVTFPHRNHLFDLYDEIDKPYKYNVSNIVENLVKNRKKITHLNFTKLILNKELVFNKNYLENDPASHLDPDYYRNYFINNVIEFVLKNSDV